MFNQRITRISWASITCRKSWKATRWKNWRNYISTPEMAGVKSSWTKIALNFCYDTLVPWSILALSSTGNCHAVNEQTLWRRLWKRIDNWVLMSRLELIAEIPRLWIFVTGQLLLIFFFAVTHNCVFGALPPSLIFCYFLRIWYCVTLYFTHFLRI